MEKNSLLFKATWVRRKEIKKTGSRKIFLLSTHEGTLAFSLHFFLYGEIYISFFFFCLSPCSSTNNGVCVNHFLVRGLLNQCIINIFINKESLQLDYYICISQEEIQITQPFFFIFF